MYVSVNYNFYLFLAKVNPSSGDYTIYDGGFLRSSPSSQTDNAARTDDQKRASNGKVPAARVNDRGHYLALVVGKGLNSKDSSKWNIADIIGFLRVLTYSKNGIIMRVFNLF